MGGPALARRGAEQGAALLIVLWMLLLLSVLAAAFISTTRSDLAVARNDVESARARALADAGVARAVVALGDSNPRFRWRPDGTVYSWPFAGGSVAVSVFAESGKIDLNAAPGDVLASLFRFVGADDTQARGLAQAVLDRRAARLAAPAPADASGMIEPNLPAFADAHDLGALPGMNAALLHAALPLVTVYSRSASVDPMWAPRAVLLALPGADAATIDAFLAARAQQAAGIGVALAPPPALANYLGGSAVTAVTVRADATTDTGARFVRDALVMLRDAQNRPYVVRQWDQGLALQ